jgi:hypothetical protein
MQNSLWENSYSGDYDAGGRRRKTLSSVSSRQIEQFSLHTCFRKNLEAMAQLTSM